MGFLEVDGDYCAEDGAGNEQVAEHVITAALHCQCWAAPEGMDRRGTWKHWVKRVAIEDAPALDGPLAFFSAA